MPVLKELLLESKDGEWGKDAPFSESTFMAVIRGTDFDAARVQQLNRIPSRYVADRIAARKRLKPWDVILETAGGSKNKPTGRTLLVKPSLLDQLERPVTCASFARFLRIDPTKAHPPYIFWLLQFLYGNGVLFKYHTQHTGVARFQYTTFAENEDLVLPNVTTQCRIASILSAYDDLIENNTRRIAVLEEMARRLYEEWFVHFRFPGGTKSVFKETDLGLVPEDWRVLLLSEVADVIDCLHSKKPSETPDGVGILLQLFNIKEFGILDVSNTYRITEADYEKWISRFEAREGDCVITNVGRIGAVAQIPKGIKAALGRNMTGVRANKNIISSTYLIQYLLSSHMRRETEKKKDAGTIMDSLNVKGILKLSVPVPERHLLARFDEVAAPMRRRIEILAGQVRNLRAQRDLLLPKLVSGEINVAKAEEIAEEAA
jgi:restriction endonuclease S subunit